MTAIDRAVEAFGRRLAARSTRRSFLGRVGRVAVLVAAGPTLATLLAGRAEARVCGQSGVSPQCPTYDCVGPGTGWGWCWYASGNVCCAGGGLKKICDCCKVNHPNVHGYCPAGANVYCIVESCFADPRLQGVAIDQVAGGDPTLVAAFVSRYRFATGTGLPAPPVLADAANPLVTAIAAPFAAVAGVPLLLTRTDRLAPPAIAELERLRATSVRILGAGLGPAVEGDLARYGIAVERVGSAADIGSLSVDVGRIVLAAGGQRRVLCMGQDPLSAGAAPVIAATAATARLPVVIGSAAGRALAAEGLVDGVYVVGPETAADQSGLPGAYAVNAADAAALGLAVSVAVCDGQDLRSFGLWLPPNDDGPTIIGLFGAAGIVLTRPRGSFDRDAEAWVLARQGRVTRAVWVADTPDAFSKRRLQSALNHFDAHRLTGVSGQGLPVISQPLGERELGQARVAGVPPSDGGGYWVSRANPTL